MDPVIIGLIGLAILFLLIFLRLPIGFAMLLVGIIGVGFLTTMGRGVSLLGISPFTTASSYLFCVLPLFILMGLICNEAGLITEIYYFFYKWFGHLPGGLAIATMGSCAAYAAVSGESLSSASIMGKVALPEMRKYKYSPKFAAATIATGGTLGILIPPSAGFILYGIITETSIGKLFIAGIVPGILLALLFVVVIYTRAKLNPSLGTRHDRFRPTLR